MSYTNREINCTARFVFMVMKSSVVMATAYKMVVIALDRYLHTIFVQNYATRFSNGRFNLVLFLYLIAVGFQTTVFAVGIKVKNGNSNLYTMPLNFLLFAMLITFYFLALKRLRSEPSPALSRVRSLTKPLYFYSTFYLVAYIPNIMIFSFYNIIKKNNIGISLSLFSIHLTVDFIGITSYVAFIVIDRDFRRWIINVFAAVCQKSNTVDVGMGIQNQDRVISVVSVSIDK